MRNRKIVWIGLVSLLIVCFFPSAYATDRTGWLWPVASCYSLSRGYNTEGTEIKVHKGIDIAASSGAEVRAAKGGTVVTVYSGCKNYNAGKDGVTKCKFAGKCDPSDGYWEKYNGNGTCNWGYGNGVIIKHNDDTYSYYAHMRSDILVKENDTVKQGQPIGYVYSSGNSEAPHLHFGIGSSTYTDDAIDCNPDSTALKVTSP